MTLPGFPPGEFVLADSIQIGDHIQIGDTFITCEVTKILPVDSGIRVEFKPPPGVDVWPNFMVMAESHKVFRLFSDISL